MNEEQYIAGSEQKLLDSNGLTTFSKEPLLNQEQKNEKYKFTYSTEEELAGKPSKCRIITITILILASCFLPFAILIDSQDDRVDWDFPWNSWLVYVFILNTTLLMVGGAYIVSTASYPYSNSILVSRLTVNTNSKFGLEFGRCVDRMTRMIKDITERQTSDKASIIMEGREDSNRGTEFSELSSSYTFLSERDIYMRVAQNLELIDLYIKVNRKIIDENPQQHSLFLRTTQCLGQLKQILDSIEVQIQFKHLWFKDVLNTTFWNFFNRYNVMAEVKEEKSNITKFFSRYKQPIIPQTEENMKNLATLMQLSAEFSVCVQESVQTKCSYFRLQTILFGRSDQAKHILNFTFEGKHFFVEGPDRNRIDCMFFPCTSKEQVIDYEQIQNKNSNPDIEISSSEQSINGTNSQFEPAYLSKPTIIMCNPNALFFQQMVNTQNAYWLNFFLKRDINVMCWNYRGYGESSKGLFDTLTPAASKRDAERVLSFIINNLKIKGKIAVYGRSIGGITACHLAGKYNDLIEVLICDRTLSELQSVSEQKLKGKATTKFFELYTNGWNCLNPINFTKADKCFKILTCDPKDDTIDEFSCLMSGVARELSKTNYDTEEYKLFHESLVYVCDYEERLFQNMSEDSRFNLQKDMQDTIKKFEDDFAQQQRSGSGNFDFNVQRQKNSSSASSADFRISFIKQREAIPDDSPFFQLLHVLQIMLSELNAGVLTMRNVLGITREANFNEFKTFLQVMEVYSCGYADDVDYQKFGLRQQQTHQQSMIIQLQQLIRLYEIILFCLDSQEEDRIKGQLPSYHGQFKKFLTFQNSVFTKLLDIQNQRQLQANEFANQGHLVQFSCGHRGQPSRIEEKRVSRLLRGSGFIPQLQEIANYQQNTEDFDFAVNQTQIQSSTQIQPTIIEDFTRETEMIKNPIMNYISSQAAHDSDEEIFQPKKQFPIADKDDFDLRQSEGMTDVPYAPFNQSGPYEKELILINQSEFQRRDQEPQVNSYTHSNIRHENLII